MEEQLHFEMGRYRVSNSGLSFFDKRLETDWGFVCPDQDLFGDDDIIGIQKKYGFEFSEDIAKYYNKYKKGWMNAEGPEVVVPDASSLSSSGTNTTDLWTLLHCGRGPCSIESETDRLREDHYLNDGWANSHIVIAANSSEHRFTQKILGPDKGTIHFFDLWEAGANHNPADFLYPIASDFQSFIEALDVKTIPT